MPLPSRMDDPVVPPGSERGVESPAVNAAGSDRGEITIQELVHVVSRNLRALTLFALAFAGAMVLVSVLQPRSYASTVSFMPYELESGQDEYSRVAAQFGFALPNTRSGQSPQFYADLLTSRAILNHVVQAEYPISTDSGRIEATLTEIYSQEQSRYPLRKSVEILRDHLSISVRGATGVVEFTVRAGSPELAEGIASRLVDFINTFNLQRRQSRARQEREFVAARLDELRADLADSEAVFERFLERNRDFRNSPQLLFEYDRLQRQVEMRQGIVTEMAQAYEQARIAEVRNTPVITLIDAPGGSAHPRPRRTVLKAGLGLLFGGMLGLLVVFGKEFLRRLGWDISRDSSRSPSAMRRLGASVRRGLRRGRT